MPQPLPPGARAPHFDLPSNQNRSFSSDELVSKPVVLLCFPAAGSEITEGLAKYGAMIPQFKEEQTEILGISDAPVEQLAQMEIPFLLLSDAEKGILNQFGVLDSASCVSPTTFIVDGDNTIRGVYDSSRCVGFPNPPIALRAVRKMSGALRPSPISANDWRLGPSDARVTLIEYSDYECPKCIDLHFTLKAIGPGFHGKIARIHRHLPLRQTHPLAEMAAEAAEAAGAQGKFWAMHDRLFEARGALAPERLLQYASEAGIDIVQFGVDLNNHRFLGEVNDDFKQAIDRLIKLPPTLFMNGVQIEPPFTPTSLIARIESLLR